MVKIKVRTTVGGEITVDKDLLAEWMRAKYDPDQRPDLDAIYALAGGDTGPDGAGEEGRYLPTDSPIRVAAGSWYDGAGDYGWVVEADARGVVARMLYDGQLHRYARADVVRVALEEYGRCRHDPQSDPPWIVPGLPARVQVNGDRYAYTVIQVTHAGKRAILQQDKAILVAGGPGQESQEYIFHRDEAGATVKVYRGKDGRWHMQGGAPGVLLGRRSQYRDPHI